MLRLAATIAFLTLSACSENISPRAERVFYRADGMATWGTVCQLNRRGFLGMGERGYISVAHVTENGTPLVGPKDAVTVSDGLSDWSFLGIDPARLNPADYPTLRGGDAIEIHGFPARDRDGEIIPGVVYADDPVPPFWWVELRDADEGIAAEGVIGGISGSCVFNGDGALVAVVHANGFSRIEGTTHTWAKIVPVREAILQAQARIQPVMQAQQPAAPTRPVLSSITEELLAYAETAPELTRRSTAQEAVAPLAATVAPAQPRYRVIDPAPAAQSAYAQRPPTTATTIPMRHEGVALSSAPCASCI